MEGRFLTAYTDHNVIVGEAYTYRITASDDFDQESATIQTNSVTVEPDRMEPWISSMLPRAGRVNGVVSLSVQAQDNIGISKLSLSCRAENGTEWEECVKKSL